MKKSSMIVFAVVAVVLLYLLSNRTTGTMLSPAGVTGATSTPPPTGIAGLFSSIAAVFGASANLSGAGNSATGGLVTAGTASNPGSYGVTGGSVGPSVPPVNDPLGDTVGDYDFGSLTDPTTTDTGVTVLSSSISDDSGDF